MTAPSTAAALGQAALRFLGTLPMMLVTGEERDAVSGGWALRGPRSRHRRSDRPID